MTCVFPIVQVGLTIAEKKFEKKRIGLLLIGQVEIPQLSGVRLPERLAPIGIMGAELIAPLKHLEHHTNIVNITCILLLFEAY